MNKEDFVSFKQAFKLKELGFDWKCTHFYENDNEVLMPLEEIVSSMEGHDFKISSDEFVEDFNKQQDICSAPTLSQAQKWLREVKNIHIEIKYVSNPQYEPWVGKVVIIENYPKPNTIINTDTCDTYEEALSEGINEILKLIKQ